MAELETLRKAGSITNFNDANDDTTRIRDLVDQPRCHTRKEIVDMGDLKFKLGTGATETTFTEKMMF